MTTAASVPLKGYPRLKFRRCLLCLYLVLLQFAAAKNATGTDDALTHSEKGDANFAMQWGFLKTRNGFEKIDRVIISTEKNAKESNNHHDDTENPNLTYLAEEKNRKKKSAMEWLMATDTYVVCVLSLAGILLLNILFLLQDLLTKNGLSKVTSQNWSNLSSSLQMTIMALPLLLFHVPVGGDVTGMSASKGTYFQNQAQGRYLQGYAIESFYDISMFQCQIQCVNRLPKCRSINYIENEDGSSICEINKESQYCALPGEYILRKKSLYLETMPETDDEVWCSTCNYSGVIVKTNEAPGFTCSCKEGFYGDRCQHTGNPDYDASKTVYYKTSGGWILVARYSNNDDRNWINVTGHWWYDKVSSSGAVLDPSENNDMISEAFWTIGGTELKISRSDDSSHTALLQTTSNCLGGRTMREKITSYGNFQNGSSWANDLCRGKCQVSYGGNYSSTDGFEKHSCSSDILNSSYIGFWCHWGADAAIIMIGGGGSACDRADHGIGITEENNARFVESKPLYQDDFGFYPATGTGVPQVTSYSLNLWVR